MELSRLRELAANLGRLSVTVLCGGISSERAISLESGHNVADALSSRRHRVTLVEVDERFVAAPPRLDSDVVFIALHGRYGEDGGVQALLENRGIPFTGSGSVASALAMDKVKARHAFSKAGLTIASGFVVEPGSSDDLPDLPDCAFPMIVKPACEGSSYGITVADDLATLIEGIRTASAFKSPVLVERFIKGRELTVGLIEDLALPIIEVKPKHRTFDFDCKYSDGKTAYEFEHGLRPEVVAEVQSEALKAFRAAGCRGIARVDMIRDAEGCDHILEINTIPGMTSHSLIPLAAARVGMDFATVCETALALALENPREQGQTA